MWMYRKNPPKIPLFDKPSIKQNFPPFNSKQSGK